MKDKLDMATEMLFSILALIGVSFLLFLLVIRKDREIRELKQKAQEEYTDGFEDGINFANDSLQLKKSEIVDTTILITEFVHSNN